MKSRSAFVVTMICVGGLMFSGMAMAQEKITITFADHNAIGSTLNLAAERFKEIVEENTEGKVEVRYFPASQLGNERENIEGVRLGTVDMCYADPPYLSNIIPKFGVMDLPYMFKDWAGVEAAMDGEVGKILKQDLLNEGVRILGWFHVGFRDMLTIDTPIKSIDDFKGLKFRSPEVPVYIKMFKAIGASPTPVPWGEVYNAMKTKIVDGMETTPEAMVNVKLYEVGKYVIKTRHINTAMTVIINEGFFQGLPEEIQEVVQQAVKDIETWQRETIIKANEEAYAILEENGMTILTIDPDPLREACKPVWKELLGEAPGAEELTSLME